MKWTFSTRSLAWVVLLLALSSYCFAEQNVTMTREQWEQFKAEYTKLRTAVLQLNPELQASQEILAELRKSREEQRVQLSYSMDSLTILKNEIAAKEHLEGAKRIARKVSFGAILAGSLASLGGLAFNDIRVASIGALCTVTASAFSLVIDL